MILNNQIAIPVSLDDFFDIIENNEGNNRSIFCSIENRYDTFKIFEFLKELNSYQINNVLVVDFNLVSPTYKTFRNKYVDGILDMFWEYVHSISETTETNFDDFLNRFNFKKYIQTDTNFTDMHFSYMPASNVQDFQIHLSKYMNFSFETFYEKFAGKDFMNKFKKFVENNYKIIIVFFPNKSEKYFEMIKQHFISEDSFQLIF